MGNGSSRSGGSGGSGGSGSGKCYGPGVSGLKEHCYNSGYEQGKASRDLHPSAIGEGVQAAFCRASKEATRCYTEGALAAARQNGVACGDSGVGKDKKSGEGRPEPRQAAISTPSSSPSSTSPSPSPTTRAVGLGPIRQSYPHEGLNYAAINYNHPQCESFEGQLLFWQRQVEQARGKDKELKDKGLPGLPSGRGLGTIGFALAREADLLKLIERYGPRPEDDGCVIGTVTDSAEVFPGMSKTYKRSLRKREGAYSQGKEIWDAVFIPQFSYERQSDGTFVQL